MNPSIQQALKFAQHQLHGDVAKLEAEILLAHLLQKPRSYFYSWPEQTLTDAEFSAFKTLIEQRRQGQPIAYLVGEREFWGLNLKVNSATLIPRADTETLVEAALNKAPAQGELLDLGTGSGAIAIALARSAPRLKVYASDYSDTALEMAQHNAHQHQCHIHFLQGSWYQALEPIEPIRFDVIVSNPPYICAADPHLEQGDLRFEPLSALASGTEGLDDLKQIIAQAGGYLKANGWLLVEHGYDQAESVAALFAQHGFKQIELIKDLSGQPRVTQGCKGI